MIRCIRHKLGVCDPRNTALRRDAPLATYVANHGYRTLGGPEALKSTAVWVPRRHGTDLRRGGMSGVSDSTSQQEHMVRWGVPRGDSLHGRTRVPISPCLIPPDALQPISRAPDRCGPGAGVSRRIPSDTSARLHSLHSAADEANHRRVSEYRSVPRGTPERERSPRRHEHRPRRPPAEHNRTLIWPNQQALPPPVAPKPRALSRQSGA